MPLTHNLLSKIRQRKNGFIVFIFALVHQTDIYRPVCVIAGLPGHKSIVACDLIRRKLPFLRQQGQQVYDS